MNVLIEPHVFTQKLVFKSFIHETGVRLNHH